MANVVRSRWEHIEPIAANMRDADRTEVWLAAHKTPHESMKDGFTSSVMVWTIMDGDTPIGMFGVSSVTILSDTGIPWLLGTDGMLKISKQFIRESMYYLNKILAVYPHLLNFVHAENVQSLRWLRWMGFDFYGPFEAGPESAEFFRFERNRDV